MSNLSLYIREAIADYLIHNKDQSPAEWLQNYLGEKLPPSAVDAIHTISGEILDTLDLMEQKKASLDETMENGTSAEEWFTDEVMAESGGNAEKARAAAAFFNGIVSGQKEYGDAVEDEEVVIDENSEEWQDDSWNDYKLKHSLKALVLKIGKAGLKEIASDIFLKASEEGVSALFSDREFIVDTLAKGTITGLKTAVAAGLTVASANGIIPESSVSVLTATAFKAVESVKALADVINGKCSMTEALISIKNTAIATASGIWEQHKGELLTGAADFIGMAFGPYGAVIAGAICGLFAETNGEARIITILKEAGKAVARFLTKEIHLPFLSKAKVLQVNA